MSPQVPGAPATFNFSLIEVPTSVMLSHSESASCPVTSITRPDVPDKSMVSKPSVVPELVQLVVRAPSIRTSTFRTLVEPLYSADDVYATEPEVRQ